MYFLWNKKICVGGWVGTYIVGHDDSTIARAGFKLGNERKDSRANYVLRAIDYKHKGLTNRSTTHANLKYLVLSFKNKYMYLIIK